MSSALSRERGMLLEQGEEESRKQQGKGEKRRRIDRKCRKSPSLNGWGKIEEENGVLDI